MNSSTSDICPQCGKPVEILNGDVDFSLELHRQSHKSLETIAQNLRAALLQPVTTKTYVQNTICPECDEYVAILNNDIPLSFQLHNQTHKLCSKDSYANGKLSASSSKNYNGVPFYEQMRIDDLFEVIPSRFQAHKQFICKNERNDFFCVVCKLKFGSVSNSLPRHLKTLNKDCFFENDKGRLMCLNCDQDVPANFCYIKSHLLGIRHVTNTKKLQNSKPKIFEDVLLTELAERDVLVKGCKKNFIRFNDYYLCNMCNTCICRSGTNKVIKRNVVKHVNGNSHLAKHKEALLCKLLYSDETVRINRSLLRMENNQIVCTLCNTCIEISVLEKNLRQSLVQHLNENKHKANQTKKEETFVQKLNCAAQELNSDVDQSNQISQVYETGVHQPNRSSPEVKINVHQLNKEVKEMETNDQKSYKVGQEVEIDTYQSNQVHPICHELSDLAIR